jgi:hypothetical protein
MKSAAVSIAREAVDLAALVGWAPLDMPAFRERNSVNVAVRASCFLRRGV